MNALVRATTWPAEFRATLALAWPLILSQLVENLLFATQVAMLGWLGSKYLAGGILTQALFTPLVLMGMSTVSATSALISQARGRRDIKAVRHIVRQGLWLSIAIAALATPIALSIKPIYEALGQDPELTQLAQDFVSVGFLILFPANAMAVMRSYLSAFGATRIILLSTLGALALNALLSYALILGNFGLPRLGLTGAAIANATVNFFMVAVMLAYALTNRRLRRIRILAHFFQADWKVVREILRVGLPIGFTVLAEVGLFSAASILMGWLGTNETAAHAVALQVASTAFMVPLGLGLAAMVRVGIAYGAGDREGVGRAAFSAIALGVGFMGLTALLFVLAPGLVISPFLDIRNPANAVPVALAASYLAVAGLFQLVDGAQVVVAHALRGLSDTRTPMLMAIGGYWGVGLPTGYVLAFVFGLRGVGVWLGLAVGLAFVCVLMLTRFTLRERLGLLDPKPRPSAPGVAA
jgi:MATE family multidrug resistance protein